MVRSTSRAHAFCASRSATDNPLMTGVVDAAGVSVEAGAGVVDAAGVSVEAGAGVVDAAGVSVETDAGVVDAAGVSVEVSVGVTGEATTVEVGVGAGSAVVVGNCEAASWPASSVVFAAGPDTPLLQANVSAAKRNSNAGTTRCGLRNKLFSLMNSKTGPARVPVIGDRSRCLPCSWTLGKSGRMWVGRQRPPICCSLAQAG